MCAFLVIQALLVLSVTVGCKPVEQNAPVAESGPTPDIVDMYALLDGRQALENETGNFDLANVSRDDPNWPVLIYLRGEILLKRGELEPARSAFSDLAKWGLPTRKSEGGNTAARNVWGGSGLATVALWRWLQILDDHGGSDQEIAAALEVASGLQRSRLFAGMVRSGLLYAMPLLEEDVARRLARIANKAGRPEAMTLFLDFINIDSSGDLDADELELVQRMIEENIVTAQRLDLFRFRRQLHLVKVYNQKVEAAEALRLLWEDESVPTEVRAEAGYEWANFYRRSKSRKPEVVAVLGSAYDLLASKGQIAEKALFRRAMVQGSVAPKRNDLFYADMRELLELHPASRLADDALYQIAMEQLFGVSARPKDAFETFETLRAFPGASDWQDSAYFIPAMGHFDLGSEADLAQADRLLAEYVERYPEGVFRWRSLFWRARIAESRQDLDLARRLFKQVVAEVPFSYHGIRARMHLESGAGAVEIALPRPGSSTFDAMRTAYRQSSSESTLVGDTQFHQRLMAAEESGLYIKTREIVDGLGKRFRNRLDGIALEELDANGLIPPTALLLAWRQDALAARDAQYETDNQLRLVAFMGQRLGDWPAAMFVASVPASAPRGHWVEMQNDPRYLSTTYPSVASLDPLGDHLAEWAWPIDGSLALGQSLMYASIRRESAYFRGAISAVGALGLFQIMPQTFKNREDCWMTDGPTTPSAYLFDAGRNVQFWSCWVRKEFEPRTREDVAFMLIRHHAGTGNLNKWRAAWEGRTIENDLELQIDTLRFPATQVFVRHVLGDIAIADSAGLFEDNQPGTGEPQ